MKSSQNLSWSLPSILFGALVTNTAWAQSKFNMTQGVSAASHEVYDLHMMVLYICTAIGLVVFGAIFWSVIFHRKSKGHVAATFHESTKVEILWTVIPIFILIAMAYPATKTLMALENNDDSELTIQVTASQWKWHYRYFDKGVEFYSVLSTPRGQWDNLAGSGEAKGEHYLLEVDKPLVIPTHRKIRFLITADDVIHSWWVPAFAVKQDAVPGFINEAWAKVDQEGVYRGQCAELCGKDHGYMPIVVEARAEADFDQWLAGQKAAAVAAAEAQKASLNATLSMAELMELGESTYQSTCAACHQPNGEGVPPAFPALKGSPIALGDVAKHIDIVVNGRAGTAMQAFGKQLSLKQLAAVITYERNAWGNNTGDMVQTSDINAALGGETGAAVLEPAAAEPAVVVPAVVVPTVVVPTAVVPAAAESAPAQILTLEQAMAQGQQIYQGYCAACHQPTGLGMPPVFPALKGSAVATGPVAAHIDIVVHGSKRNPSMVGYEKRLTLQELAAVITYERNAWGNNTGTVVQAADVAAIVKQKQ